MKDKRLFAGIVISTLWIGVAIWVLATQTHPEKINEWGDFIAGFSAPLAFLWLVLGYMQQGEELKHSTAALKLQAEELKNSVEQQTQLVAVSREQIRLELAALEEERERKKEAARPKFVVARGVSMISGNVKEYSLQITNIGRTATNVDISFSGGINAVGRNYASFDNHVTFKTSFSFVTDSDVDVNITYYDSDDIPGNVVIPMRVTFQDLVIDRAKRIV